MRRFVAVAIAVAGLLRLTACGSDDTVVEAGNEATTTTVSTSAPSSTAIDATTTTTGENPVSGEISLTVQIVWEGTALRDATLTCSEGRAEGTGYLADPSAAQAACDLLGGNAPAASRLVNGRAPGLMCTQQYGGPEVARVTGTIGDRRINVKIDRTDGCGIAEWRLLTPLLGPPNT